MSEETKGVSKEEESKEQLVNVFFELSNLSSLLRKAIDEGERGMANLAETCYLLVQITIRKLEYYQRKYDFEIDSSDLFYVEDIPKFISFQQEKEATKEVNHV